MSNPTILTITSEQNITFGCCDIEVSLTKKFESHQKPGQALTKQVAIDILGKIKTSNDRKAFFVRPRFTLFLSGAAVIAGAMVLFGALATMAPVSLIVATIAVLVLGLTGLYLVLSISNLKHSYQQQNDVIAGHLKTLQAYPADIEPTIILA